MAGKVWVHDGDDMVEVIKVLDYVQGVTHGDCQGGVAVSAVEVEAWIATVVTPAIYAERIGYVDMETSTSEWDWKAVEVTLKGFLGWRGEEETWEEEEDEEWEE